MFLFYFYLSKNFNICRCISKPQYRGPVTIRAPDIVDLRSEPEPMLCRCSRWITAGLRRPEPSPASGLVCFGSKDRIPAPPAACSSNASAFRCWLRLQQPTRSNRLELGSRAFYLCLPGPGVRLRPIADTQRQVLHECGSLGWKQEAVLLK